MTAALAALPIMATADTFSEWQEDPTRIFTADEVVLDELKWKLRGLFVFGEDPNEPAFVEQLDLIAARRDELVERDVIVIVDTNPDERSTLRNEFRPRAFMMVLTGKDGEIELRKPAPQSVRELSRTIDKMPMRQQEIHNRRTGE